MLSLHFGQCGTNIGASMWDLFRQEHPPDSPHPDFFEEAHDGTFKPRCIFADFDSRPTDRLTQSQYFSHSFFHDNSIAPGNWATASYQGGEGFRNLLSDHIRKQLELADSVTGFCLTTSLGGATGSALAGATVEGLLNDFNSKFLVAQPVLPSVSGTLGILEPYNAILGFYKLHAESHIMFPLDNQPLIRLCVEKRGIPQPTFANMNQIAADYLSDLTASSRFGGLHNCSIRKLSTSLVPFPRVNILLGTLAPLGHCKAAFGMPELNAELRARESVLCAKTGGVLVSAGALYRGSFSTWEVEDGALALNLKSSFKPGFNDDYLTSLCKQPPLRGNVSGCALVNSNSISQVFKTLVELFTAQFRRKAFLHHYTSEGMDEMEFTEAESNMNDLISEYDFADWGAHISDDDE